MRFHFGELALVVLWRAGQVVVVGRRHRPVWQMFTLLEIMFHHSDVELPPQVERRLCRILVTPRMHGIHHSTVQDQTSSNGSSDFTAWD